VMGIAIERLSEVPEGVPPAAGPAVAVVTLAVATMLALRATGIWRLWAPLIGIASGSVGAALFGLYDPQRVLAANWFYIPNLTAWPGLDLSPGVEFWTLLPAFLIVSLVAGIKMSSDGVVIQQVSRVKPQATDFRLVQAAVNTSGLGMLLSGLAGTLPTIAYTPSVVTLITLTGVAARSVGYAIGAILLVLAVLPKVTAVLLTIPSPVMGAFLLLVMGMLFVEGMRMVVQDGLDQRKALVVGVALALGVGLESQNVLADLLGQTWGASLGNGLTVGILAAVLLTFFIELTSPRHTRLETTLEVSALPKIDAFLRELAAKIGWNEAAAERLRAAGEETLTSLLQSGGDNGSDTVPRLIIMARPGEAVELEFIAVFDEENLEDRLAHLSEQAQVPEEHEISFWLLRHYASSVRHRKYHGIDVVTVQVEGSR
ncbi:MAG: purine/pyrimidine permease, partial [Chloroflexota bacterium]|nr:purine/pyrimidine permease [Chloroflexota bacterium]